MRRTLHPAAPDARPPRGSSGPAHRQTNEGGRLAALVARIGAPPVALLLLVLVHPTGDRRPGLVAHDLELEGLTRLVGSQDPQQGPGAGRLAAVNAQDHVAALEPQ